MLNYELLQDLVNFIETLIKRGYLKRQELYEQFELQEAIGKYFNDLMKECENHA